MPSEKNLMVRTVFDGEVHVHYSQIYVESRPDGIGPTPEEAFPGQVNGLCGAASPGGLYLATGLHTGRVGFTVQVCEAAPDLTGDWEDVVEVSFSPASPSTNLVEWAGAAHWPLGLERMDYRVRYCAWGMDTAHAVDTRCAGEPQVDRYLLQFWPAPPSRERIVKQTSESARYRHSVSWDPPPTSTSAAKPPAGPVPDPSAPSAGSEGKVEASGGESAQERLTRIGGNARLLVDLDPELAYAIADASAARQRELAR